MTQCRRRRRGCDARIRPVLEAGGKAVSVGRAFRTVPERTRVVIEEREGVVFTDHRGYRLDRSGRPVPPRRPVEAAAAGLGIPAGAWSHPSGERLDPGAVSFHEPERVLVSPQAERTGGIGLPVKGRPQSRQYIVTTAVPTTPGWKASTNCWASWRVRK